MDVSLEQFIGGLVENSSFREVGEKIGLDSGYLYKLFNGDKINPSEDTLAKLGLVKRVVYQIDERCQEAKKLNLKLVR